jgi:unsaturated rhamnogalacturonyl hydrolase
MMCASLPVSARIAAARVWRGEGDMAKASTTGGEPVDWSKGVAATMMHKNPDPAMLGGWGYAVSLALYGQYLVYLRTGDKQYLEYIQGWVDHNVNDDGMINKKVDALDYMLPGNLLLVLYKETGKQKYKVAAESIRHRLDTYPLTEDGGLWHATSRQHQLWLDGMFMSMPFLVRYGVDAAVTR